MRDTRRLMLRREALAALTGDDLSAVVAAALPPTREQCRTALSLDDACPPVVTYAAGLLCVETLAGSSCACVGG